MNLYKPIVEKQLKDETAVKKIDIDYIINGITVEFDRSFITKEDTKDRLEKIWLQVLSGLLLPIFKQEIIDGVITTLLR
ncbi:MAG TPA: hypothetical protein VE622_01600 [Nitrososphaeraceae archaeon]|nr:hypothetical protein [Nitrososphaeraceae archaeon]